MMKSRQPSLQYSKFPVQYSNSSFYLHPRPHRQHAEYFLYIYILGADTTFCPVLVHINGKVFVRPGAMYADRTTDPGTGGYQSFCFSFVEFLITLSGRVIDG